MKPSEIFWLAVAIVGIVILLGLGGMLLSRYVDLPQFGEPEPTPTPADTREAQPPLADDIERLTKGLFDVIDVAFSGDLTVTIALYIPGEDLDEEGYLVFNSLLASQFQVVRIISVTTVEQLGNPVYVISYVYDCLRNPVPETAEAVPLICADGKDVATLIGKAVPDVGLKYLNE